MLFIIRSIIHVSSSSMPTHANFGVDQVNDMRVTGQRLQVYLVGHLVFSAMALVVAVVFQHILCL